MHGKENTLQEIHQVGRKCPNTTPRHTNKEWVNTNCLPPSPQWTKRQWQTTKTAMDLWIPVLPRIALAFFVQFVEKWSAILLMSKQRFLWRLETFEWNQSKHEVTLGKGFLQQGVMAIARYKQIQPFCHSIAKSISVAFHPFLWSISWSRQTLEQENGTRYSHPFKVGVPDGQVLFLQVLILQPLLHVLHPRSSARQTEQGLDDSRLELVICKRPPSLELQRMSLGWCMRTRNPKPSCSMRLRSSTGQPKRENLNCDKYRKEIEAHLQQNSASCPVCACKNTGSIAVNWRTKSVTECHWSQAPFFREKRLKFLCTYTCCWWSFLLLSASLVSCVHPSINELIDLIPCSQKYPAFHKICGTYRKCIFCADKLRKAKLDCQSISWRRHSWRTPLFWRFSVIFAMRISPLPPRDKIMRGIRCFYAAHTDTWTSDRALLRAE